MSIVVILGSFTVAFSTWALNQMEATTTATSSPTTSIDTTFWGVILIAGLGVLGWVLTQAVRLSQLTTRLESRMEGIEARHGATVKNDEILFGLVRDLQSQISTERVESATVRARCPNFSPQGSPAEVRTTTTTTTPPPFTEET